jgi:hypothetical protein
MPPDLDQPFAPEDITFLSSNWCSLSWSPWVPFNGTRGDFKKIPDKPGVYRIRPVNQNFLMYIGQTGRALRKRFSELRRHTLVKDFPWNDPHTAAQSLWVWNKARNYSYEFSGAPVAENNQIGWESFLLAKYRQEHGESTLCNFGRFHKRYKKSTNKKKRTGKEGIRGRELTNDEPDNPSGNPCSAPLKVVGKPGNINWMGLAWSMGNQLAQENIRLVPKGSGIYVLLDPTTEEIVYIGEGHCKNRLRSHSKKKWEGKKLVFMYCMLEKTILPHQLHELENDLIGNFFECYQRAPVFQFENSS